MANNKKICCIFNFAPHYRAPIYKLMDKELHCDFYFGDNAGTPIKKMDYSELQGFKKELINIFIPNTGFEWLKGSWQLIFKPYKYYIITGTPGSLSNWILAILAIPLRKKVYAWTHGMKGNTTPSGKFIEKHFYRLCSKNLLYGEDSKKIMLKEGFREQKLVPIYNSLDYDQHIAIRQKLVPTQIYTTHFGNDNPVIIYIGRIQKRKKLDQLVYAIKRLNDDHIYCNLIIIGSDVEDNDIPKLINDLNLEEKVWIHGPCYDEVKIGELLFNANVSVTPGPVGLTALHSLTFGCPVISNNDFKNQMPEYEAIIADENGAFFESNNLESLADTIKPWLALNPAKRNSIRHSAYNVIDYKYNPHYQLKVLKQLIND
jgi:glycosyltransferase involved in cell wall biosynthesis